MEAMFINMGIMILETAIKNPTFQAQFKTQLLTIAGAIYTSFGLTPPATPPGF